MSTPTITPLPCPTALALAAPAPLSLGDLKTRLTHDFPMIDQQGWNGPTAVKLLTDLRRYLIEPLIRSHARRLGSPEQATASAWSEVWEVLRGDSIRAAEKPWPLLWTVARRAMEGEISMAMHGTTRWKAKRLADAARTSGDATTNEIVAIDDAPELVDSPRGLEASLGVHLAQIHAAMVQQGWNPNVACQLMVALGRCTVRGADIWSGWRTVALQLGLPQWQVRRVQTLICGTQGVAGLLQRVMIDGHSCLADSQVQQALRSTLQRSDEAPQTIFSKVLDPGVRRCAS